MLEVPAVLFYVVAIGSVVIIILLVIILLSVAKIVSELERIVKGVRVEVEHMRDSLHSLGRAGDWFRRFSGGGSVRRPKREDGL